VQYGAVSAKTHPKASASANFATSAEPARLGQAGQIRLYLEGGISLPGGWVRRRWWGVCGQVAAPAQACSGMPEPSSGQSGSASSSPGRRTDTPGSSRWVPAERRVCGTSCGVGHPYLRLKIRSPLEVCKAEIEG